MQVLDLHADQFIAAEAAPEAEQDQGSVAAMAQFVRAIAAFAGDRDRSAEPVVDLCQSGQLQRLGLLLHRGVHRLDALEHFAHQWRAGGIDEPVLAMPGRQRS